MEIWTAYWHAITWLREMSNNDEEWTKMFWGRLERCLPLSVRLSGNLDMAPVMWISSDATLTRIGVINWRNREFICCDIGNLFAPFVTEMTNSVYISDVELLALVLGIVVWATDFPGTTLGITDNLNALHWVSGMKAKSGISLQLLRTVLKWIVNTDCDFSGLYSRSHHNVSADHLTRLSYEEITRWAKMNRFKWIDPFEANGNWASFIKTVEVTMVWEPEETEKENLSRAYWNPEFGHVIDWNPGAADVGRMCRENSLPMWVSTPKHSVLENWYRNLGVKVWNQENNQGEKFFLQVGLAKTEFEILDFQHHCEGTGAENAILIVPSGVGMPTDLRWNWTHKFVMDSCVFGDVIASEWTVLTFTPFLTDDQAPGLNSTSKRVLGDAMAENGVAPELENELDVRVSEIERTRGMKVIVKNPDSSWAISQQSHLECFSLAELRRPTFGWPKELAGERLSHSAWIGILGGLEEWKGQPGMHIPENVAVDALWRLKPVGLVRRLISACYQAEAVERYKRRQERIGNPYPEAGSRQWTNTAVKRTDVLSTDSLPSWGKFRVGRCYRNTQVPLRCGSPQGKLNALVKPLVGNDRVKFFLDQMASGTRSSYWGAWNQWLDFAQQRNHSCWVIPNDGENWDANFLEFLLFHHKVMQRKAGTLRTKIAAVRFFHLIHGKLDFSKGGTRIQTLLKGIEKREIPNAKRPFNIELLEWMKREKEKEKFEENEKVYMAAVIGFFFLLRVSEIANITRDDVSIEDTPRGKRLVLVIRKSKTDQSGMGVTRALLSTPGTICPVRELESFLEGKDFGKREFLFGGMLRLRLEGSLKAAAVANGVSSKIIGSHSLRAGGATALYVRGVSITLIQRFGRWKSSSFLRYLWFDTVALEPLAGPISTTLGLLEQLRMSTNSRNTDARNAFRAGGADKDQSDDSDKADNECNYIILGDVTDTGALLDREEERRDWACRSPSEPSNREGSLKSQGPSLREKSPSEESWSGERRIPSKQSEEGERVPPVTGLLEMRERSPSEWSGSGDEPSKTDRSDPSQRDDDEGESEVEGPKMQMRERSPSKWSRSEKGSQSSLEEKKEEDSHARRRIRTRPFSGQSENESGGEEKSLKSKSRLGRDWHTNTYAGSMPFNSGGDSALENASKITGASRKGGSQENMGRRWKLEKKEEKGDIKEKMRRRVKVKREEDDLSVSEVSTEREHLMVKQEIWNDDRRERTDRNREMLDKLARKHQLAVKEEWNRPCGSGQNPGRGRPVFEPMKVEIFPRSPGGSRVAGGKENRMMVDDLNRRNLEWKRSIFMTGDSSEEEESNAKTSRFEKSNDARSVVSRTVGPWDSVSQVTRDSTVMSETKRVKSNVCKQAMKKGRNRRMKPEEAKRASEKEKVRIQDMLKAAEQLWRRLECPVQSDSLDILSEYHPDAVRYARQGKKFISLAKECGTIRAKTRMRDEWKAECYGKGLDHRRQWKIVASMKRWKGSRKRSGPGMRFTLGTGKPVPRV